jgi:hypothetical protein
LKFGVVITLLQGVVVSGSNRIKGILADDNDAILRVMIAAGSCLVIDGSSRDRPFLGQDAIENINGTKWSILHVRQIIVDPGKYGHARKRQAHFPE